MNIMLTCAGRRNYLIQFFRTALQGHGQVIAVDASADAPALQEADQAFVVPPIDQPGYMASLLTLCHQHQVRLLIPAHDLELPLLAWQRAQFLEIGTIPVISSPDVIDTCFDKWATAQFLAQCDLAVPYTYLSLGAARQALERGEIIFPLVVKPRWGTTSIGIEYPEDDDELEMAYKLVKKRLARTFLAEISATDPERCILIQERLWGHEYGLDVVNDLNNRYVCTFARRKLRMRAGQTDRAITVQEDRIERLGALIGQKLSHTGTLDCDVFVTEHACYVLDMNPRFGTGYPFSHFAGANLPAALIAWANQEEPDPSWFKTQPNVLAAKCDMLIVMDNRQQLTISG
jgi:carbamoyl-phosphate synthase large subunit